MLLDFLRKDLCFPGIIGVAFIQGILADFIGLFTGAIILAIGYQMAMEWLQSTPNEKNKLNQNLT